MNISGVPTDLQPRCLQSFKPSVVIVGGIMGISQDFTSSGVFVLFRSLTPQPGGLTFICV